MHFSANTINSQKILKGSYQVSVQVKKKKGGKNNDEGIDRKYRYYIVGEYVRKKNDLG